MMKRIVGTCLLLLLIVFGAPVSAHAGVGDWVAHAKSWWSAHTLDSNGVIADPKFDVAEETEPVPEPADPEEEESEEEEGGRRARVPGMCVVPQEPAVTACEIGSGFICVNTPPGGVDGDTVRIRGTIDRRGSVLASIRIAAQNEYTKRIAEVDTSEPAESDCWKESPPDRPFCIDGEGRFSALVALADPGPATITVTGSRLSGESLERRVRVSRVIAPELGFDRIQFDPDVTAGGAVDAPIVTATVDLLGDCQFCDFIGASTGGITVTAENVVVSADGTTRRVSCPTTVEQGGQGRFLIGVPVLSGQNTLTVRACNAAVEGHCPEVSGITFSGAAGEMNFDIQSPPPQPAYDAADYPKIPWSFSLGDGAGCISMQFNREGPAELCPDASGIYHAELHPRSGINVATLAPDGVTEAFAWSFGWGTIESPHAKGARGRMTVPSAAQLALPARTAERMLIPFINNFLASDEFQDLIADFKMGGDEKKDASDDEDFSHLVPKCGGTASSGFRIALRGKPKLGHAEIRDATFETDAVALDVRIKNLSAGIDLHPDNGNAPLPLTVVFRRAKFDIRLEIAQGSDGEAMALVTSPHDDCDFKRGSYCQHKPTSLIPQHYVGGAHTYGGFIRCEVALASGGAKKACKAFNSLNAMTGVIGEKVLDAINDMIYCGGSAALTKLMRRGIALEPIELGCAEGEACEGTLTKLLPPLRLPLGVSLDDGLDLSSQGLLVSAGMSVGDADLFSHTPKSARVDSAGLIRVRDDDEGAISSASAGGKDLTAALSLDAINALLFALVAQGDGGDYRGLLDIDVHEHLFNDLGFDFVKECDQFVPIPGEAEAPPTLCHLRPRVGEMLGSALSTYGYFEQNQPLLLAIRGNRALGPRLAVTSLDELPVVSRAGNDNPAMDGGGDADVPEGSLVELQLGGVTLSFYALDADRPYDADGAFRIQSMRPELDDPWDGPIVSFDLTLLLGIEVGDIELEVPEEWDDQGQEQFVTTVRTLADRSRLVLTPIEGTNATSAPPLGLISALREKISLGIAGISPREKAIRIPIPREIALESDDPESMLNKLGLRTLTLTDDGLGLSFDDEHNAVLIGLRAIITQVLHQNGKPIEYTLPK